MSSSPIVDVDFETEQRAVRWSVHTVLARAGFGDDAAFAHAAGEQDWPWQLLFLWAPVWRRSSRFRKMLCAAQLAERRLHSLDWRRAAGEDFGQQVREFGLKGRVLARFEVGAFDFFKRRHVDLGVVAATVGAEVAGRSRASAMRCS